MTHSADPVRTIYDAINVRANRERLWAMPLFGIDLYTMAEEIAEKLLLIDGSACDVES